MTTYSDLTACELHLHVLGAYDTQAMVDLGRSCYEDVDWDEDDFLQTYNRLCHQSIDPEALFRAALESPEGMEELRRAYVYTEDDGGDFDRWEIKNRLFLCVWGYYRRQGKDHELLQNMLERHVGSGMRYVEYRCGSGMGGFLYWHELCARVLSEVTKDDFTARYIISIPRYAPMDAYGLLRQLLSEHPELLATIVGVDFASVEEGNPPKDVLPFFEKLRRDNAAHPEEALDAVYHVGESYFDKSIESAVRWCHEVAEMGAKRIGHGIALGLDPAVAVARRAQAHEVEPVSERLDQISYDLQRVDELSQFGVIVDEAALSAERKKLHQLSPDELVERPYDDARLEQVRRRQRFALEQMVSLGTVIECCPTSNLRIGGVPEPKHHPVYQFLKTDINLVICTDDPGGFEVTLPEEVDWVVRHGEWTQDEIVERLGDPRRFRLGAARLAGS